MHLPIQPSARCRRSAGVAVILIVAAMRAGAAQPPVSQFDEADYDIAVSSHAWDQPPESRRQLFLDVYDVIDLFDSETGGAAGFIDQTLLADTLRPAFTLLWGDRVRIQLGLVAERTFGSRSGFNPIAPWLQLLWKPAQPLSVILGNLDTPHYFMPALFYAPNYFLPYSKSTTELAPGQYSDYKNEPYETGMQLIFKRPWIDDDFYFNYRQLDTPEHNEKFDLGFVHRNNWKWLYFNYQAHWVHNGGELYPGPFNTRNDIAQAVGLDLEFHPWNIRSLIVGGGYTYIYSHLRQDADNTAEVIPSTNGYGDLWQAFLRWGRLKLIYGDWRSHHYSHEEGDPMYALPVLDLGTIRWDILMSHDFNLYAETTGYFIGNNNLGYSHNVKAAFHIQAAYQFSIPILEWTTPVASPEGEPLPARWDYGI